MKRICEIKGLEHIRDIYYITRFGKVISYGNYGSKIIGEKKELKQYEKTGGYLNVALMNNDATVKYHRVSRLVAMAFVENKLNKPYVNHIDTNRRNNNAKNLEWVTPKENNLHSMSKKLYMYDKNKNLIKIYNYAGECVSDGFNQGHVCACARGEEKTHKGYIWRYEPI